MRRVLSLVWAACLLVACHPSFGVYDLRCEGLVEPLGIDSAEPHFSWKIRSDKPMEQAAYEIEVGPDLWQSGKVESPDQVMVPYDGLPLYSRQQAWWRVRVWDSAGKASAWSPKQRFGIGVLDGLKGDFIGAVPGEGKQPVFRKVFTADKSGEAILHVTSLGYHEVYFNGNKVSGEGPQTVLLPSVSQLDKRSIIVTYGLDLRKGENEIMIYAGSGWYKLKTFGVAYDGPLVKAELDVDGVPFLWTDDSWQGAWSGRKDLGTWEAHRFGGEWIQAAVEPEWGPVDYVAVEGIVSTPMMCPPIRVQEMLEPVSVEKRPDGSILVDFGRIVNAMPSFLPERRSRPPSATSSIPTGPWRKRRRARISMWLPARPGTGSSTGSTITSCGIWSLRGFRRFRRISARTGSATIFPGAAASKARTRTSTPSTDWWRRP